MNLWTIGFTKISAERFFSEIQASGARRLIDVRLNNVSQLAGFAKRDDLRYFLRTICQVEYVSMPSMAPTSEILDAYRKRQLTWTDYEQRYRELIQERRVEVTTPREIVAESVLLCSEDKPDRCHRRVLAEYLAERWGNVEIRHLPLP